MGLYNDYLWLDNPVQPDQTATSWLTYAAPVGEFDSAVGFTISLWFSLLRPNTYTYSSMVSFISNDAPFVDYFDILSDRLGGAGGLYGQDGPGSAPWTYSTSDFGFTPTVLPGAWNHIAVTMSNGTFFGYSNGAHTATWVYTKDVEVDGFVFGRTGQGVFPYDHPFDGALADIRMYNYPLLDDEVATVFSERIEAKRLLKNWMGELAIVHARGLARCLNSRAARCVYETAVRNGKARGHKPPPSLREIDEFYPPGDCWMGTSSSHRAD